MKRSPTMVTEHYDAITSPAWARMTQRGERV